MSFPTRLQRCDIYNQSTTRISAFPQTYHQHIFRDAEILNRMGQNEAVGWYYTNITLSVNKALIREILGINQCVIDICENLKIFGASCIISIGG